MATVEYLLHIDSKGSTADFKLKYKHGRFHSIEQVRGKLTQEAHERLLVLAPQLEEVILLLQTEYKGRVTWEKVVKQPADALYSSFLEMYCGWYKETFKLNAKINGISVNALKSIIQHLKSVSNSDDQAYNLWARTLANWASLSSFYQTQTELRQINSNLNIILRETGSVEQSENLDDKFKKLIQ